jgi:hypothetical protein
MTDFVQVVRFRVPAADLGMRLRYWMGQTARTRVIWLDQIPCPKH